MRKCPDHTAVSRKPNKHSLPGLIHLRRPLAIYGQCNPLQAPIGSTHSLPSQHSQFSISQTNSSVSHLASVICHHSQCSTKVCHQSQSVWDTHLWMFSCVFHYSMMTHIFKILVRGEEGKAHKPLADLETHKWNGNATEMETEVFSCWLQILACLFLRSCAWENCTKE